MSTSAVRLVNEVNDRQVTLAVRRGRHRDHALAAWRRSRAVELKVAGHTYEQIATELGYANRGTVHRVVSQALERRVADDVDLLRRTELDRLDRMTRSVWDDAMAGDLAAVAVLLKISVERSRLLGLHGPAHNGDSTPRCRQPQTVVLQADDCRLRGCPEHA